MTMGLARDSWETRARLYTLRYAKRTNKKLTCHVLCRSLLIARIILCLSSRCDPALTGSHVTDWNRRATLRKEMSDIIYISYHHRLAMASLNRCSVAPYTLGRGGVHRLGPQIGAPKPRVPNYRWCTVVPRNSIVNMVKSPVSALRTQWRFFAFSPPNLTNFQGGSYTIELSVCSPYGPPSDGKVISNSDDQIFSNRGPNSQNSHSPPILGG